MTLQSNPELKSLNLNLLEEQAKQTRRLIIEVAHRSQSAHVGSSLSCVDILIALYFHQMHIVESDWQNRDIFITSKAHAAMALYATLTLKGVISPEQFFSYNQNDGALPSHLDRFTSKGIETSTGALGHGFNIGLGIAHGLKLQDSQRQVYSLIGDGETMEGSIWEGAMFAPKLKLDNFTAFMDYNKLQGYGSSTELCQFEPIVEKWEAFGWEVLRINGHNFSELISALQAPHCGRPKIIIADTIKGKGVSFMENEMKWHYFLVSDQIKDQALAELT